MRLQAKTVESRKEQAEGTDRKLLEFLVENPGVLSLYDVAQMTGWSVGRVQKGAERLLAKGLIAYRRVLSGGRTLKLLVPVEASAKSERPLVVSGSRCVEVRVPAGLVEAEAWGKQVCVYALDRLSFGLSPVEDKMWRRTCLYSGKGSSRREDRDAVVEVPEEIAGFYLLGMTDYVVSAYQTGKVLVTVESTRRLGK